jgi:hypothetical protein
MLREWDRLRGCLENSWSELILHRQLTRDAADWLEAGKQNESFLLRGDRPAQFERWSGQTHLALSAGERAYLRASIARREERAAAERQRQEQEARLEGRHDHRLRHVYQRTDGNRAIPALARFHRRRMPDLP